MLTIIASNLSRGRARNRAALRLDQFLNRIGQQTWGGYLSNEGLEVMLAELRSEANRNTAVQIIHEHAHRFETIALIGNRKRFQGGLASVGKVLQRRQHAPSEMMRVLRKMAETAALWHDTGKLYRDFQAMVHGEFYGKHRLRHYTASYFAYRAWLATAEGAPGEVEFTTRSRDAWDASDGSLATRIAASLILTHHCKTADSDQATAVIMDTLRFGEGVGQSAKEQLNLSVIGPSWQEAALKRQAHLESLSASLPAESEALAFYLSRAILMLADHAQSASERTVNYKGVRSDVPIPGVAYAKSAPFIPLADHLMGVTRFCGAAAGAFLSHAWPRLESRPEAVKTRPCGPFSWQHEAERAISDCELGEGDGFFGVVIAETGTGKTQGGFRIMSALAGGKPRYTLGLGFGALAIQSGIEYRKELGLTSDETAIFVGRRHAGAKRQAESALEKEAEVSRDNEITLEMLSSTGKVDHQAPQAVQLTTSEHGLRMLSTPIISMTIDHIIAAMEADRGSYITAALRVATSDLLIDEVDSFTLRDLHAIGRLLYVCGLYARKVVICSATTTPEIAQGMYQAYRAGYRQFQAMSGKGRLLCGIFSNRGEQAVVAPGHDMSSFKALHSQFVAPISLELLSLNDHRRTMTTFSATPSEGRDAFFETLFAEVIRQSQLHGAPLRQLSCYSTGFVRFNLIKQAQAFTLWLIEHHERLERETGWRIRANYYGANLDSKARQFIEGRLGVLLNRKTHDFGDTPELARLLDDGDKRPTLFLLVTTPIIEVGRDYDLDFAILEPCSDMSLIQSAGRVLRHRRDLIPEVANISLMPFSLRELETRSTGNFLYGHRGPGVEQIDPVEEVPHRLPADQSASEAFGLALYTSGVHAGHRLLQAKSPADKLDRKAQWAVLLGDNPLSLASFSEHPNPFLDKFYDKLRFRGKDEEAPSYEYHYLGCDAGFCLADDEESRVVPKMLEEACESKLFLLRPQLMKHTILTSRTFLEQRFRFAPALGLIQQPA